MLPPSACSDVGKIHAGIGDKVALLLQWLAVFVGGFVIGFVRDWRLTLVLLGFTPFLAIGGFIMTKVRGGLALQPHRGGIGHAWCNLFA